MVVMDSGLAALRRPGMTIEDSSLALAMTECVGSVTARRANLPHSVGIALTPKSVASLRRPASSRGALRDRHECWQRDAMDAILQQTNVGIADGEVVWSWRPDAGAKVAGL